ncbi:MAG: hypothetical protein IPI88_14690 [Chitinophagaceae bacterium]|nr:hypothetical protein [Chitinophagaceae bacterium]MBK7308135.1 hypothetical protein [Chitinophagaceae bacterium]MBL0199708.1 hypothetical protein [Chitinophagaceae bacterium]
MKEVFIKSAFRKILRYGWMLLLCLPVNLFAQTDSAATKETETKEEASLISPSLDFIVVQKSDNTIDLKATVKAKIKGTFLNLRLLKITFLQVSDTTEKNLGFIITDERGKATLNVKNEALIMAKDGSLNFKASFAGNKQMETADGEVTVKKAQLQITPVKEDSLLTVKVKFVAPGAADSAGKDLTIGIFVNRSFNPLKIGEGTTDENGEVTVEIPANLPGDDKGNITLLAKIDENENYGNLEASVTQQWGIPVSDKQVDQPRALWSVHPPIWMLVTFIALMVIVWGHFLVIVYELFRLRKEEPHQPNPITNT